MVCLRSTWQMTARLSLPGADDFGHPVSLCARFPHLMIDHSLLLDCSCFSETAYNNNNLRLMMVKTDCSTLHTVNNIEQSAMQGSNDTRHRLSRRTAATTRFSPEGIGARNRRRQGFANIRSGGPLPKGRTYLYNRYVQRLVTLVFRAHCKCTYLLTHSHPNIF